MELTKKEVLKKVRLHARRDFEGGVRGSEDFRAREFWEGLRHKDRFSDFPDIPDVEIEFIYDDEMSILEELLSTDTTLYERKYISAIDKN